MRATIRAKILIFFAATLVITSAMNLLLISKILKKDYKSALHSELLVVGSNLQTQLKRITSLGISTKDIEGFDKQCQELVKKNEHIIRAMVIDTEGTIIFHNDCSYQGSKLPHKDIVRSIANGKPEIHLVKENNESIYFAVLPFGDTSDYAEYAVVICSPAKIINDKIFTLINRCNIVLLSTFGLAAFLLLTGLKTMLNSPLAAILNTMKNITKSRNLEKRVDIKTHDEIGQIADAFNKMTSDLQQSTTSIDNLNREIAEREKAENELRHSETRFRQIVNNASEWIWEVDSNGLYTYSSPVIEDLLGYKPEEIVQKKHFYELFVPEARNEIRALAFEKFVQKEAFKGFPNANVHKNGQTVWLMTSGVPILDDDGNVIGYRGSDIDITAQKAAEETMKQLNEDLENTVAKLEEANANLKKFVYIASHDLREPLRKITAFGNMLKESLGSKIAKEDSENLNYMVDGAGRLSIMIEGLLAYSRVNTKGQAPKAVDLNEVIRQLKQVELSVLLEEKNATIEVPEKLPTVKVDLAQIRQLMQNLVANGIKYQKKDATPHITITFQPAVDGMVRIEVTDNGIGIKPEFQQAVFEMFRRLHSRSEYEGTGIGLAVCKKIVERHGGQLGVESEYGKGCTFWFTIPVAAEVKQQAVGA